MRLLSTRVRSAFSREEGRRKEREVGKRGREKKTGRGESAIREGRGRRREGEGKERRGKEKRRYEEEERRGERDKRKRKREREEREKDRREGRGCQKYSLWTDADKQTTTSANEKKKGRANIAARIPGEITRMQSIEAKAILSDRFYKQPLATAIHSSTSKRTKSYIMIKQ